MAQQNNPFYVDPTGGVDTSQSWNTLNRGISNLGAALQKKRDEDAMSAARQEVSSAVSSNDPDKIADAMIKNPQLAKIAASAVGYKNDVTRNNAIDSAKGILTNPDDAENILATRIKTIADNGGDPSDSVMALQEYREDPEGFLQSTKKFLALNDPKGYKAYAESTGDVAMTPYQKQTVDIRKQDQKLREMDIKQKQLQARAAEETNSLKKKELEQKIAERQANIESKRQSLEQKKTDLNKEQQEKVMATNDALRSVDDLINHPGLESAVGFSSKMPTVPGSDKADFKIKLDNLISKLTLDNMGKMKGVLSDADIKMIRDASSGLDASMSEDEFKKQLNFIKSTLQRKLGGSGQEDQGQQVEGDNYNSLWGD